MGQTEFDFDNKGNIHNCETNCIFYHDKRGSLWTICHICGKNYPPTPEERKAFQAGVEYERLRFSRGVSKTVERLVGIPSPTFYTELSTKEA